MSFLTRWTQLRSALSVTRPYAAPAAHGADAFAAARAANAVPPRTPNKLRKPRPENWQNAKPAFSWLSLRRAAPGQAPQIPTASPRHTPFGFERNWQDHAPGWAAETDRAIRHTSFRLSNSSTGGLPPAFPPPPVPPVPLGYGTGLYHAAPESVARMQNRAYGNVPQAYPAWQTQAVSQAGSIYSRSSQPDPAGQAAARAPSRALSGEQIWCGDDARWPRSDRTDSVLSYYLNTPLSRSTTQNSGTGSDPFGSASIPSVD